MTWTENPSAGFDLETTGVDVETARIVTAAVVFRGGSSNPDYRDSRNWLSDVGGEEIPDAATVVHGITTALAHVDGSPAAEVVEEIAAALYEVMAEGLPVVAFNGRYDFSVLDRECRRYGVATLEDRLGRAVGPVIDPFIIDKQADKYRKGSRKLEALAIYYGVKLTDAHTADADALAALEVAVALAEKYEQLRVDAETLHGWQVNWAAEQAVSFRSYRERQGLSVGDITEAWPVIPYPAPAPHQPRRDDAVATWLKAQRDAQTDGYGRPPAWYVLDGLLDAYRLHADTGTPLDQHVCEGRVVGDCACFEGATS